MRVGRWRPPDAYRRARGRTCVGWRRDGKRACAVRGLPVADRPRVGLLRPARAAGAVTGMRRSVRDNGLGLAFGGLFLATLVGQAFAGLAQFNEQQVVQGSEPVSLLDYLTSSSFAVDVVENWQSEYLQFFLYIFATVWLVQRGSSESKEVDEVGPESERDQRIGRYSGPDSPRWARTGDWRTVVFSRSLG